MKTRISSWFHPKSHRTIRLFFVWLHRWAGLLMTLFLIIVGLTGSLLAFKIPLERLICPRIYATPRPGVPPLDFATLAEHVQSLVPQGQVESVLLLAPDQAQVVFEPRINPVNGKPYELNFTELLVDPWTGQELDRRREGDLSQGLINLMPFIYNLHVELSLGNSGYRVLGIVALVWTIDCFIAFYLTLPVSIGSFWRRWKPAWLVKWLAGAFRLNFDLHRAGGLWAWVMLFVFAWSSVMFNLSPVYNWVTRVVFDHSLPSEEVMPMSQQRREVPGLGFRQALLTGRRLMAEQATKHSFFVEREVILGWEKDPGDYYYLVKSSRDVGDYSPETSIIFDADSGALRSLNLPTGQHSGDTITTWLHALHMADVFGLPYRIFVFLFGLVITMLSVTGVYIWWKKRKARLFLRSRIHHAPSSET